MSKYLWVAIIVFTLFFIQVVNEPKDSFALDPNSKDAIIAEPNEIIEPNQAVVRTQPFSDANEKKISLTEDANCIEDVNNAESESSEENAGSAKESPEKKSARKTKVVENTKAQEKLSKIQNLLQKEFTKIFADYVTSKGNVNYSKLRRQRLVFKSGTNLMEDLKPDEYKKWSKEDKIAFWINTYNFHKLKAIIENYPIEGSRWLNPIWGSDSIRHIKNQLDTYKFIVMNEEFTFYEVEKRFFKDLFKEPRVFFAITMGTESSPPMLNTPYHGIKLYQQLDDQVRNFLADERIGFKTDEENKIVYLSLILKTSWYGNLFTEKYSTNKMFKDKTSPEIRAVLNFIINYIPQNKVSFLQIGNYSVKYLNYSWLLNE